MFPKNLRSISKEIKDKREIIELKIFEKMKIKNKSNVKIKNIYKLVATGF